MNCPGTKALLSRGVRRPGGLSRRAFTLVEVIMSVSVLALAITTSITVMQRAFLNFDSARNLEVASRILQCELEKQRLLPWAQVSNSAYTPTIDAVFLNNPKIAGRFTLQRSIALLPDRGGKLLQITLTATWRSYDGRTQSRSYTTYYGENGLYSAFTTRS